MLPKILFFVAISVYERNKGVNLIDFNAITSLQMTAETYT